MLTCYQNSCTLICMDVLRTTLVELVRLGLKGDAQSVRRFTQKLIKKFDEPTDDDIRQSLAKLLVEQAASPRMTRLVGGSSPITEGGSDLVRVEQMPDAKRPSLPAAVLAEVAQIVRERESLAELTAANLGPTRTLLLKGPPGVGKTMTARYLASQLAVPLVTVDLARLMSSLLGQSSQNLRQAIEQAKTEPCVLFLDEFDAIAKRRDDPSDVGEIKRIVNVLLLELEDWPSTALLIAATNHPELLDRAIWRRFERTLEIGKPDLAARRDILIDAIGRHLQKPEPKMIEAWAAATDGLSGSEITTLVMLAVRKAIVEGAGDVSIPLTRAILDHLLEPARTDIGARERYCAIAHAVLGFTQRQIAEQLELSHVTVGKLIKRSVARQHGA